MPIISVVIPCYKTDFKTTLKLIKDIPQFINNIILIDDKCPYQIGNSIFKSCKDKRLKVLFNIKNLGVGGAVIRGYHLALRLNSDIIVKLDGDGQMDPSKIDLIINPLINNISDYSKGNRFSSIEYVREMPMFRLVGNFFVSIFAKITTGYWNIFDFSNGFTAIKTNVLKRIINQKLNERFFFETDILYHLYIIRAKVVDVPMKSIYAEETSNLKILETLRYFPLMMIKRFFQRILLIYFVLEISLVSFLLFLGIIMTLFGSIFGIINWNYYSKLELFTPTGIIIIATLNLLLGLLMIILFFIEDSKNVPKKPISHLKIN